METYGQETQMVSDTIKTILCTRLDFYVEELKYFQNRKDISLPQKVLDQIEDSIQQGVRTKEEIAGWTVGWAIDVGTAHHLGAPVDDLSQVKDGKDYVIILIGKICEAIWQISRVVTFDGKVLASPYNRPPSPYGAPFYGAPNYAPPPVYGSQYSSPQFRPPGQFSW